MTSTISLCVVVTSSFPSPLDLELITAQVAALDGGVSLDPRFTKLTLLRPSLVVQWLRIQLPMQGTQVQSLDQEDATCCRASKPVHRNSLSASSLRSATREAAAVRSSHTDEEQPPLAEMRESLRVAMKTQNNQKLNLKHQPALNGSIWSVRLSSGGT